MLLSTYRLQEHFYLIFNMKRLPWLACLLFNWWTDVMSLSQNSLYPPLKDSAQRRLSALSFQIMLMPSAQLLHYITNVYKASFT